MIRRPNRKILQTKGKDKKNQNRPTGKTKQQL